jgi:hypothetical protein
LESNAAAADLELSDDEDRQLTEAADRFIPLSGVAAMPHLLRVRRSGH